MAKRTSLKIFSILLVILLVTTILLLMQVNTSDNKSASSKEINTMDIPVNTDVTLYVYEEETTTFEYAFWVHSNRWVKEGLDWEVYEISFDPGVVVSCNPNSGIIYPGDPPHSCWSHSNSDWCGHV